MSFLVPVTVVQLLSDASRGQRELAFLLVFPQRALEPPDVHHERLLPVSVAGLLVNLVGVFVFQHGGHGHSHGGDAGAAVKDGAAVAS